MRTVGRVVSGAMILVLVSALVMVVWACPHPDLPVKREASVFRQQLLDELDADSTHSFDVLNYDITIFPDMVAEDFTATVAMEIVAMEDNLDQVTYNLAGCTISDVLVDGVPSAYNASGEELTVTLPVAAGNGDTLVITTSYSSDFRYDNYFGGMIYSSSRDVLYTFGEPYATRYWLACYDLPFDKSTMRMTVEMDDSYKVVSNGYLVTEENIGGGMRRTVWRSDDAIATYLISLAIHPYVEVDLGTAGVGNTPMSVWTYAGDEELTAFEFGRTGQMIELFEGYFGAYPFNKYDQALVTIFNGWGAMEHQTATSYGDNLVFVGNRTYEYIVAHELAHQWFGDEVSPLTFADIWLNEGFASYCEYLWIYEDSPSQAASHMNSFHNSYFNEDSWARFPIYDPPNGFMFSTTVYKKGASILHMLRWVLGDTDFFQGMRDHLANNAYGNATTDEFQSAMETASGMDLDDFFNEWVYQAGYPEYFFRNLIALDNGDGTWTARIELLQQQGDAPYFSTPLPLLLTDGTTDTLVRLDVAAAESQTLEINGLAFAPDGMEFDPDGWILCTSDQDLSLGLALLPVGEPVTVPATGGQIDYNVVLRNNTAQTVTVDAWTEAVLPNGSTYGPLVLREDITLAPFQTVTPATLHQQVPNGAPAGSYYYVAKAGTYPGGETASDRFPFEKLGAGLTDEPAGEWTATGWESEVPGEMETILPPDFEIANVYPNPFNSSLTVTVALPSDGVLELRVFNALGRQVAEIARGRFSGGYHTFSLNGSSLSSGIYFVQAAIAGQPYRLRKVALVK